GYDVLVALAVGAALDIGEIRAGAGLRERRRTDPVAARAPAQQLGPAFGGADVSANAVTARNDAGNAHPGARKLFGDERVLEDAAPHSAPVVADHDPEVAHLADALQERVRDVCLLLIELVGKGKDLVYREAARGRLDFEPLLREIWACGRRHFLPRLRARLERLWSITNSPCWLKPSVCQVTIPNVGCDADSRVEMTSLQA